MVETSFLGLFTGIYSIFIGVAVIGLWLMLILKKQIPDLKDRPIEIYFHVTAEMLMGFLSTIAGIGIIFEQLWSVYLFLITSGFYIYSVINSSGYYAQRKTWVFLILFGFIFITSTILSIFTIIHLIELL